MLAVTQGDPAGIGPELCLRLLQEDPGIRIFGSQDLLAQVAEKLSLPFSDQPVVDIPLHNFQTLKAGQISAQAGAHSFACLEAAMDATQRGEYSAVVTNPIHKEAWNLAGKNFPGHTEYLVEKTGATSHAMMLTSQEITCSLVTTHIALSKVSQALTEERILEVIELTAESMQRLRKRPVKLAMPGLNPHAGEGGLFGREEIELIIPTLEKAREKGIEILGPLSPDTAFLPQIRKEIDAYVCLYHDQGLIPLKTLAFDEGVNVTLGLPVIRTSVDHGTAFDIAWRGIASPVSLQEAIRVARDMSEPQS